MEHRGEVSSVAAVARTTGAEQAQGFQTRIAQAEADTIEVVMGAPHDRVAALAVALLLVLLAAVCAAVNAKVADASPISATAASPPVDVSDKDLAAFSAVDNLHTGPRDEPPAGK